MSGMFNRGALLALACVAVLGLAMRCSGSQPTSIVGLTLIDVVQDSVALDYVVKSKIYKEDPSTMYLTMRGGGVSVYDVSNNAMPTLRTRWDSLEDVEGQDRLGDLLVVVGRGGKLFTFDVSDPDVITPIAEFEFETDPSLFEAVQAELLALVGNGPFDGLHVKLDVIGGNTYAFVTATATGELLAIDVTDPSDPVQVGAVDTGVEFIEGIFIKDHHAFVGGFGGSEVYKAVDVSDPTSMFVAAMLPDVAYRQMVSEMAPNAFPDVLFAALWNDEGGLGTFDVSNPATFFELDQLVRPELTQSNRVKINGHYAFLPLEQEPGGVAVIDVNNTSNLALAGLARNIRNMETPYTLQPKGNYVYVFGTSTQSMAVLKIDKGTPVETHGVWNFGPGTNLGDLAGAGVPADDGVGSLFYLDPGDAGGTASHASTGTAGGIGYLALSPGGTWTTSNGLWLQHQIPHTFYGNVLQYTLVWDVYVPQSEFDNTSSCSCSAPALCSDIPLYQLDRANSVDNDAELFIKVGHAFSDNGCIGKTGFGGGGLEGYADALDPDTWHRVAMVVDLREATGHAKIYVDGAEVKAVDQIDYDLFAPVSEGDPEAIILPPAQDGFLLFADNDGEFSATIYLSSLLFVDRAYSGAEVAALGVPDLGGIPAP